MSLRIVDIDFSIGAARIDVNPADARGALDRVNAFLQSCAGAGIGVVRIGHRAGASNLWRRALEEIAGRHGASVARHALSVDGDPPSDYETLRSELSPDDAGDATAVTYTLTARDMSMALERLTASVVLIGQAAQLDDSTQNCLRFAVYELSVNTVEHATFSRDHQEISLAVTISDTCVRVDYRDNADPFATDGHNETDVASKIEQREKRGLGLFVLNKMGDAFDYRRDGAYNVTDIRIRRKENSEHSDNRRNAMDKINIEVTPCDIDRAVIVSPTGSIDSATCHAVEAQMESLIEQGYEQIVIDFSGVDFVSSAGIGIFLGAVSRLRGSDGDLIFMSVPAHIDEVFDIINLKSFFRTIESTDELDPVHGDKR